LVAIRDRLANDGTLIIQIPIIDSYEYETYGKYWSGCDAPVHVMMYSRNGLYRLLDRAGLKCVNLYNLDGCDFMMWSEIAQRGYSLADMGYMNIEEELGAARVKEIRELCEKNNRELRSGLATFAIKKK
jgi:hypothetical protein